MQIKTQLDIELNEDDVKAAVAMYLASNNVSVSAEELATIKFVNTRNDGIKANLTVSNEQSTKPIDLGEALAENPVVGSVGCTEPEAVQAEHTPDQEAVVEDNSDEPGVIAASTVEDVMPSIDEVAAMQTTDAVPTIKKSLFGPQ